MGSEYISNHKNKNTRNYYESNYPYWSLIPVLFAMFVGLLIGLGIVDISFLDNFFL